MNLRYLPLVLLLPFLWLAAGCQWVGQRVTDWLASKLDAAADRIERGR
jgi:uncharacterized SAM-binding protein YcdF (DUF218 family)